MFTNRYFTASLLAILLLSLIAVPSCGKLKQIKASVSGTVYMDGRPAAGTVILKDQNGTVIAQERTSTNGHFRITDLQPGIYTVEYMDYRGVPWKTQQTVEVRLGRPEIVNLNLSNADRAAIGGN